MEQWPITGDGTNCSVRSDCDNKQPGRASVAGHLADSRLSRRLVKLAFHDADTDTDTDILVGLLRGCRVVVGVVEFPLNKCYY